jgi:voltage-gated potassium channel
MRRDNKRLQQLLSHRGLAYSLALCVLILGLGGLGFWLVEPDVHTLSDGLWLAFTTAATVGYGDLVPTTMLSRGFAVVVVLLGLAVLSLVTASVAAMLVETDEQKVQHELLHEIAALRAEVRSLQAELHAMQTERTPPA